MLLITEKVLIGASVGSLRAAEISVHSGLDIEWPVGEFMRLVICVMTHGSSKNRAESMRVAFIDS
jgi:hypothetical protein